ncbi:hypothetical protein [Anaerosolibacter sp.]|uniref:hypothetical protein n=1 Tax=Anaerosolibacter sp. TaxID=1872527 RepID=UPI0039EF8B22
MPSFELPRVGQGMNQDELLEIVAKMNKQLDWLLRNMDSLNVTEINTNITRVQSENGETYINGPLLQMYDASSNLRLNMGLDVDTNTFLFNMYDNFGNLNMSLNSNGEAVFSGNIETLKNATIGYSLFMGDQENFALNRLINFANNIDGFDSKIEWLADIIDIANGISTTDITEIGISPLFEDGLRIMSDNMYIGIEEAMVIDCTGGFKIETGFGNTIIDTNDLRVYQTGLGFFGVTPAAAQSVSTLGSQTVSGGVDTLSLSDLNTKLSNIVSRINSLRNALNAYGLV